MGSRTLDALVVGAIGFFAGCAPEGGTLLDETPPVSTGRVVLADGGGVPFGGGVLLVNSANVQVVLTSNEPGSVLYSLDGSEPAPGASATSVAGRTALIVVDRDTRVRWRAQDTAGNLEATVHEGEVRFDRVAPALTIDPEGGEFAGRVRVRVETDEPAKVLWALDDRLPFEGSPHTKGGAAPLKIELDRTTRLRVRAIDAAGNSTLSAGLLFVVDTQAPRTKAVPPGGRYFAPLEVELVTDDPEAVVLFTTDGSVPTLESPVYQGPVRVEGDRVLRFRGVDAGGNLEPVRTERYEVGPLAPRVAQAEEPDLFAVAGGLDLAGALIDMAGPLSGREGAGGVGRDWAAWAVGRTVGEASLLQSGVGLHAMYAPAVRARAVSGDGRPDANGNGSNLDETFDALLADFAERAGATPPEGLFPLHGFYEFGQSRLLRPLSGRTGAGGLPEWNDDFGWMRWEGTGGRGRTLTAPALAGGLSALTARARAGLAGEHVVAAGEFGARVAPVVALRCAGCHRAGGVAPDLTAPAAWTASGLVTPGDAGRSPLVDLLSGAAPHEGDRAMPEQVAAVAAWIDAGAPVEPGAVTRPGFEGREAFFALLAAAQAGWAVGRVVEDGVVEATARSLGALAPEGEGRTQFTAARLHVTEAESSPGLPRRPERITLEDPSFDTGEHARLLRALVDLHRLLAERPELGDAAARDAVRRLARAETRALLDLTWDDEAGVFRAGWHPTHGAMPHVETLAVADAVVALLEVVDAGPAAGLAPGGVGPAAEVAGRALDALRVMRDLTGAYAARWDAAGTAWAERRRLDVQVAVLDALLARAVLTGDGDARRAAQDLWAHLGEAWWDVGTGIWQTTLGEAEAVYDPALAARVVRVLQRGAASGILPGAGARLARFFDGVVAGGLRPSETWLTGETGVGRDADGDGVPKPWGVGLGNGVAPAFVGRVVFR